MTGPEAEQVAARLSIHLRRNEFAACHEILNSLREQQMRHEFRESSPDDPIPVAEVLGHEMKYVNMLEKVGYVYIDDLDGVVLADLADKSSPLYLPWFGKKGASLLEAARERAEEIRKRRRRKQAERLEKLEKVGQPVHVGPYIEKRGIV